MNSRDARAREDGASGREGGKKGKKRREEKKERKGKRGKRETERKRETEASFLKIRARTTMTSYKFNRGFSFSRPDSVWPPRDS